MSSETFAYAGLIHRDTGLITNQFVGSYTFRDLEDGDDNGQTEVGDNVESSYAGGSVARLDGITQFGIIIYIGSVTYLYSTVQYAINSAPNILATTTYTYCFLSGTLISTPGGEVPIEYLKIGDLVTTEDGRAVPVKWIGEQRVKNWMFAPSHRTPVLISKGALGNGLPHSDLYVSADHGMILDGLIVTASALVNDTTIRFVPMAEMPETFTYYHIETEAHDAILANGAAAETFVDAVSRSSFDNHDEYLDLYGAERIVAEMDRPRISSVRQLPESIKARIGASPSWDSVMEDPEMTVSLSRGAA